jgi:exodeoxyribonuclease V alpha subunit
MNGSLGRVLGVGDEGTRLMMDGSEVVIEDPSALGPLELAYGITVHKAQGSAFKRVVIPIFQSRLLDRTMIYTALTRATDQVVFVGDLNTLRNTVAAPPRPDERTVGFDI